MIVISKYIFLLYLLYYEVEIEHLSYSHNFLLAVLFDYYIINKYR